MLNRYVPEELKHLSYVPCLGSTSSGWSTILKKRPLTWLAAFEWYIVDIILLNKNFEWRLHCSFCSADGYAKRSKVPILTVHQAHFIGHCSRAPIPESFTFSLGNWMDRSEQ